MESFSATQIIIAVIGAIGVIGGAWLTARGSNTKKLTRDAIQLEKIKQEQNERFYIIRDLRKQRDDCETEKTDLEHDRRLMQERIIGLLGIRNMLRWHVEILKKELSNRQLPLPDLPQVVKDEI